MPHFVGSLFEEAIVRIESEGFQLGKVEQVQSAGANLNNVVGQEPLDGYPVYDGQAVKLHISGDLISENKEATTKRILHFRADKGFLRKKVRVRIFAPEGFVDIFNDFVEPGKDVWIVIPVDVYSAAIWYQDGEIVDDYNYLNEIEETL